MTRNIAVVASMALLWCAGCAVFNRENTPTLNWFEENLLPRADAARVLSFPVTLPLGFLAVSTDAIIVRPATVVDDAAADTADVLWDADSFDWEQQYVTECTLIVPRVVVTPIVFTGDFLGRSVLDIEPREADPPHREPQ